METAPNDFSLIVHESLGSDRFVVTNNCRLDVPVGTLLTTISSERMKYTNGVFVLEETGEKHAVELTISAVEFWRKPWNCVPYGHHAGVQLKGDGIQLLELYLVEYPAPWSVFIGNVAWS